MVYIVTFLPSNRSGPVPAGTRVSDAAALLNETELHLECGGKGTCGRCEIDLVSGSVKKDGKVMSPGRDGNQVRLLACQCIVTGSAVFSVVPDRAGEARSLSLGKDIAAIDPALLPSAKDISPVIQTVSLRVKEPSAGAGGSDFLRLEKAFSETCGSEQLRCGRDVLCSLPGALRAKDGLVTVCVRREPGRTEIVSAEAGAAAEKQIGIACDVGTTTISLHCVDLANGAVLASRSDYNAQIRRGADVITRIEYAKDEKRRGEMRSLALSTVNGLIGSALDELGIPADNVFNVAIAGNTTMVHLLLGLPAQGIRESPYVPVVNAPGILTAAEAGIHANPAAAVSIAPGVGSYVGGDITSGLLVTPMINDETSVSLFMDIGTNGEIVIGNAEFLLAAACSAGPSFEGSGIKCGMRAATGAMESFETDFEMKKVGYRVIGGGKPKGICGSGLISLLGELYSKGLIDRSGRIADGVPASRVKKIGGTKGLVLVKSAGGHGGSEIVITEADIENLVRTKAAIYAACDLMLSNIGLTFDSIAHVYIAGGFGRFIDVEKAVRIGMLPDIPRNRFSYLGNSSLTGATLALLSKARRDQLTALAKRMTYIDLSSDSRYMDAYVAALFLPHTDLARFPSTRQ